jgi:hypothetical protein
VSPPIRSIGGYYILALRGRQEAMGTKLNNQEEIKVTADTTLPLVRLLLPLSSASTKEVTEQAMKVANNLRSAYQGCEMF